MISKTLFYRIGAVAGETIYLDVGGNEILGMEPASISTKSYGVKDTYMEQ